MAEIESLAGSEPLSAHVQRHRTDRIIMLSDGIFAIVTTLAALEIHLPVGMPSLDALLNESGTSLVAYGLSFLFTAVFWITSRELYARVARTDNVLTFLTLAGLCCIAIVPAAIKIFYVPGGLKVGVRFYALVMIACGTFNCLSWLYWAARPGICRAGIAPMERWGRALPTLFMPILFLIILFSETRSMPIFVIVAALIMVVVRRIILPRLWSQKAVESIA